MTTINNTASIRINVDFNGGPELKNLRNLLRGITSALNAQTMARQFDSMERAVDELKDRIRVLTAESSKFAEQAEETARTQRNAIKTVGREHDSHVKDFKRGEKEKVANAEAFLRVYVQNNKKAMQELNKAQQEADKKARAYQKAYLNAARQVIGQIREEASEVKRLADAYAKVQRANNKLAQEQSKRSAKAKKDWDEEFRKVSLDAEGVREAIALRKRLNAEIDRDMSRGSLGRDFRRKNAGIVTALNAVPPEAWRSMDQYAQQLQQVIQREKQHQAMLRGGKDIYGQQIKALDSLRYRLTHYEQQMDAIFRASFRMQMAGHTLMQWSRDILRVGSDIMKVFGDFEFMMNRAAGALGIWNDVSTETAIGTDKLQEGILQLAGEMRLFPAEEVAEALYFWGSTTGEVVLTNDDLIKQMEALDPIMKAAAMTNTGYETTIKGVYSILSQYYNGAIEKAAHVTELLFFATQKTAAEFPDLINSFKMVGPIANANAESFEDMVDLFGRLADLGVRGTMAGRAIRQLFIQAVRPSGPAQKKLDDLFKENSTLFGGKGYKETMFAGGEFVGITKYVQNLALALKDASQAERNLLLAGIATANELPVITALVVEQIHTIKALETQTKNTSEAQETAGEVFAKSWARLRNSWRGVVGSLQRGIEAIKIQLGALFADALTPMIERLNEVIKLIQKWIRENPELVRQIGEIVAFGGAMAAFSGAVLVVAGALMQLSAVAFVVIKSFGPLAKSIGFMTGLFAAFAAAIVDNFDYIVSQVQNAIDTMGDSFGTGEDLLARFGEAFEQLIAPTRDLFGLIVRMGADVVTHLANLAKVLLDLNKMTGGLFLQAVISGIGFLIAAKTILGLSALVARIIALDRVLRMFQLTMIYVQRGSMGKAGVAGLMARVIGTDGALNKIKVGVTGIVAALGPVGVAVAALGIAFVAYETNFLGFANVVDLFTGKFRDFNKEIDESTASFGALSESMASFVKHSVDVRAAAEATAASIKAISDETPYVGGGLLGGSGAQQLEIFLGRRGGDIAGAQEKAMREAIAGNLDNAFKHTNERLAEAGIMDSISGEDWADTFLGVFWSSEVRKAYDDKVNEGLSQLVQDIIVYTGNAALSREEIRTLYGKFGGRLAGIGVTMDEFIRVMFRGDSAVAQEQVDKMQESLIRFYSAQEKRFAGMASGPEKTAAIMSLMTAIVGEKDAFDWQEVGGEMLQSIIASILSGATGEAPDAVINMTEEFSALVTSINESIQLGIITAFKESKPMSMAFGGDLAAYMGMNQFDDALSLLLDPSAEGGLLKNAVTGKYPQEFANAVIATFQRMVDAGVEGANKVMLDKSFWDVGTTAWLFPPPNIVQKAAAEATGKTRSAMVAGVKEGLDARGGFREEIKAAFKRGQTGDEMANMLKDFTSDIMDRALHGNMFSADAARRWIQSNVASITDYMNAATPRARQKFGRQFYEWFKLNESQLPTKARSALEPMMNWIVGNVKIPPRLVQKVRRALNRAIREGSAAGGSGEGGPAIPDADTGAFKPIVERGENARTQLVTAFGDVKTAASNTILAVKDMAWSDTGHVAGSALAGGMKSGFAASAYLMISDARGVKTDLGNIGWYFGGYGAGKEWASGLNAAILANIDKTLTFTADVLVGTSPPPKGPLHDIDKGGYNIGKAWGQGLGKGARSAMSVEAAKLNNDLRNGKFMSDTSARIGVENTNTDRRQIDININVTSPDGSVTKDNQSEMRRAVYDALVDSSILEHMATVR